MKKQQALKQKSIRELVHKGIAIKRVQLAHTHPRPGFMSKRTLAVWPEVLMANLYTAYASESRKGQVWKAR